MKGQTWPSPGRETVTSHTPTTQSNQEAGLVSEVLKPDTTVPRNQSWVISQGQQGCFPGLLGEAEYNI